MAICFALAGEQNKTKTAEGEIKKNWPSNYNITYMPSNYSIA
jgi:hypothetical protein